MRRPRKKQEFSNEKTRTIHARQCIQYKREKMIKKTITALLALTGVAVANSQETLDDTITDLTQLNIPGARIVGGYTSPETGMPYDPDEEEDFIFIGGGMSPGIGTDPGGTIIGAPDYAGSSNANGAEGTAAVPEPTTATLSLLALAALAARRRRK